MSETRLRESLVERMRLPHPGPGCRQFAQLRRRTRSGSCLLPSILGSTHFSCMNTQVRILKLHMWLKSLLVKEMEVIERVADIVGKGAVFTFYFEELLK